MWSQSLPRASIHPMWNVIVIGGGPAGMMAAGHAAQRGAKVLLLEKNPSLGKKLLITGGGRCNVTNNELDTRKLLARYKGADKFLFSAFSQWDVAATLKFFNDRGMPTKEENDKRMFPVSNSAKSVFDVLVTYMKETGVEIKTNCAVKSIETHEGKIVSVTTSQGKFEADSFIIATGGKSHPETGSTGDAFTWLRDLGHTVVEPSSALVPITIEDSWVKKLQGLSLPDAKLTVLQGNEKHEVKKGKMLFTHFGISGPLALNLSKTVGDLLQWDDVTLSLDIFPDKDYGVLNQFFLDAFEAHSNKKFKNVMAEIVPAKLAPILVELSGIDQDKFVNTITREERVILTKLVKSMTMKAAGLLSEDKAIITSGGVVLEEVDFKTMASRKIPNLYLIGDILNIDRPSGGFSLQLCWTSGFVAGQAQPLRN